MKSCLQKKRTHKTKELVTPYVELSLPFPDSTHPPLFTLGTPFPTCYSKPSHPIVQSEPGPENTFSLIPVVSVFKGYRKSLSQGERWT